MTEGGESPVSCHTPCWGRRRLPEGREGEDGCPRTNGGEDEENDGCPITHVGHDGGEGFSLNLWGFAWDTSPAVVLDLSDVEWIRMATAFKAWSVRYNCCMHREWC
jgi:hypothetical protein